MGLVGGSLVIPKVQIAGRPKHAGRAATPPNSWLRTFIQPSPICSRGGLSLRIMKRIGHVNTPELTPVRRQSGPLPVATPAAIIWSAAAQKSGLPGCANPPGFSAMRNALIQFGNILSQEHCSWRVLPDGVLDGTVLSASATAVP